MNKLGEMLKKSRVKQGWKQWEVGNKVGVSGSTISRYEKGKITNIDYNLLTKLEEIYHFASGHFINLADADTVNKSIILGNLESIFNVGLRYPETLEMLRVSGKPSNVIFFADELILGLQDQLKIVHGDDRKRVERLLCKILIERVLACTGVVLRSKIWRSVNTNLTDIKQLSNSLLDEDLFFREIAVALPAMISYLQGKFVSASEQYDQILQNGMITHPDIIGICYRDRVVIPGKIKSLYEYKLINKTPQFEIDDGKLALVSQAKVLEGKTQTALNLGLYKVAEAIFQQSKAAYAQAEMNGDGRIFTKVQISRTDVNLAISYKFDEELVLAKANTAVMLFKSGGFLRYIAELKETLIAQTNSRKIHEFTQSF